MIIPIKQILLEAIQRHREENMLRNIDFARSGGLYNNDSKNIAVVVGDTHLRTIETPELGKASPFHNRGFNIIRSKYSEIKWYTK